MKRSNLIQVTDAVLYVVLFGAIVSVCFILAYVGGPLIPPVAIPFIAISGGVSGALFAYNAFTLIGFYWKLQDEIKETQKSDNSIRY